MRRIRGWGCHRSIRCPGAWCRWPGRSRSSRDDPAETGRQRAGRARRRHPGAAARWWTVRSRGLTAVQRVPALLMPQFGTARRPQRTLLHQRLTDLLRRARFAGFAVDVERTDRHVVGPGDRALPVAAGTDNGPLLLVRDLREGDS